MSFVRKLKRISEQKPNIPTQTHQYKIWFNKIKSEKNIESNEKNLQQKKLMHDISASKFLITCQL